MGQQSAAGRFRRDLYRAILSPAWIVWQTRQIYSFSDQFQIKILEEEVKAMDIERYKSSHEKITYRTILLTKKGTTNA